MGSNFIVMPFFDSLIYGKKACIICKYMVILEYLITSDLDSRFIPAGNETSGHAPEHTLFRRAYLVPACSCNFPNRL